MGRDACQSAEPDQSLAVDTVAGATNTSKAILAAVEDCVKQAGGDVEALTVPIQGGSEKKEENIAGFRTGSREKYTWGKTKKIKFRSR